MIYAAKQPWRTGRRKGIFKGRGVEAAVIQLVPSADSVAANISEGFGRYFFRDKMRFYFFARGSLFESQTWIEKSFKRKYIDEKTYKELLIQIKNIGIKLNNTIDQVKQRSDVRS